MYQPHFSHIYIEDDIASHKNALNILSHFPQAKHISISNYKELFNRQKQDWEVQKKSQKLILAKKRDGFLYPGSEVTPDFGHEHYYYNALVLNCIYDCEYCYLQGMYPSAHTVVFVNTDDFFEHTQAALHKLGSMYLCISYDSDLLAFEHFLGLGKEWISFARRNKNLTVELRTKSAHTKLFIEEEPVDNVVLAWTLSPQDIVQKYEHKTPSLKGRLKALNLALEKGWQVRICIDPIIQTSHWKEMYLEFIKELEKDVKLEALHSLYLGAFRLSKAHHKNMSEKRKSPLFVLNQYEERNGVISYPLEQEQEMKEVISKQLLRSGLNESQLSFV